MGEDNFLAALRKAGFKLKGDAATAVVRAFDRTGNGRVHYRVFARCVGKPPGDREKPDEERLARRYEEEVDVVRAQSALSRALNRLKVGG